MKIRIRRLLIPTLFCLAVACLIEIPLMQTTLFGDQVILWDTLFRAVGAVPVLYVFYREDRVFRGAPIWNLRSAALTVAVGAVLSLGLGFLLNRIGITGYDQAEETLFTGGLWLQLLVLLVASPLLEEFYFRGILYQRLKELVPTWASAVLTASLFGVFHGNPAQAVYGFIMGLFLALSMEKTQTVLAPILLHAAANGAALLFHF